MRGTNNDFKGYRPAPRIDAHHCLILTLLMKEERVSKMEKFLGFFWQDLRDSDILAENAIVRPPTLVLLRLHFIAFVEP